MCIFYTLPYHSAVCRVGAPPSPGSSAISRSGLGIFFVPLIMHVCTVCTIMYNIHIMGRRVAMRTLPVVCIVYHIVLPADSCRDPTVVVLHTRRALGSNGCGGGVCLLAFSFFFSKESEDISFHHDQGRRTHTSFRIHLCYSPRLNNYNPSIYISESTMISNSSTTPALHGAQITLDSIMSETHTSNRRTKILCTMGPACWSKENIGILMDAGMNVARFNFSHGDHEGHGAVLDRLREVASEKSRNIAGEWTVS